MKINRKSAFAAFVAILLFSGTMFAQEPARPTPAPAARPVFRMPARIISPEILPDNKVTFRIYSKDASKITVSGEWQTGFGASETFSGIFLRHSTSTFSFNPIK